MKDITLFIQDNKSIEGIPWENDIEIGIKTLEDILVLSSTKYIVYLPKEFIVPIQFEESVYNLIKQANSQYKDKWAIISAKGNSYIFSDNIFKEFRKHNFIRYSRETTGLHYNTKNLFLAVPDLNVPVVINVKKFKEFSKEEGILEFCYKKNLLTAVSSQLYSGTLEERENDKVINQSIKFNFIETLKSYNNPIKLLVVARITGKDNLEYNKRRVESLERLAKQSRNQVILHYACSKMTDEEVERLIIGTKKITNYLQIKVTLSKSNKLDTRVEVLKDTFKEIENDKDIFVMFLDYDDFIINYNFLNDISPYLEKNTAIIGNSIVDKENKLIKSFNSKDYYKNLLGGNYVPFCSVIYPLNIVKKVLLENNLLGTYFEDYAIATAVFLKVNVLDVPVDFCCISYHEGNTVERKQKELWMRSELTFIKELIDNNDISQIMYEFISSLGQKALLVQDWKRAINDFYELELYKAQNDLSFLNSNRKVFTEEELKEHADKLSYALKLDKPRTLLIRKLIFKYFNKKYVISDPDNTL